MNVIPRPSKVGKLSGEITLSKSSQIEGDFAKIQKRLASVLKGEGVGAKVVFVKDKTMGEQEYSISGKEGVVTIKASADAGAFYAVVTLEQMFADKNTIPAFEIDDAPRFAYRGFMLDCARHFWTMDKIKEIIEFMAQIKLNHFHWHLSEDQGWRAEIKKYPLLTEKGAIRKDTPISLAGYHANKEEHDGKEYGRGLFYTQKDMKEIVAFAKERQIVVIPEIDMPGHMVAAIACYPELSCSGEATEVSNRWGVMDNIFCGGKETAYDFAKDIIDELCEIFPGEYFHIGGDEVPKTNWKKCPACQAKIKELGLKDENQLQGHFNNVIGEYLKSKGKKMIGWNEILEATDALDRNIIPQWWIQKGGDKLEHAWLDEGNKMILSIHGYTYMDHPYAVRPLKKTYNFTPQSVGVKNESNIIGLEAPQWTEYIRDEAKLDLNTFARMAALAETAWTKDERKNYECFESRLEGMRGYFKNFNITFAPQKVYRGQTLRTFMGIKVESGWNKWRVAPNFELDFAKNLKKK